MNPKKAKELIADIAQETSLSDNCIESIINLYWRDVWESLTTLVHPKIHLENLGDFNIKHWNIDRELLKAESFGEKSRKPSREKYMVQLDTNKRIELLKALKQKVEEEKQRKEFIYEHKKTIKDSMEEQTSDSGGNQELDI